MCMFMFPLLFHPPVLMIATVRVKNCRCHALVCLPNLVCIFLVYWLLIRLSCLTQIISFCSNICVFLPFSKIAVIGRMIRNKVSTPTNLPCLRLWSHEANFDYLISANFDISALFPPIFFRVFHRLRCKITKSRVKEVGCKKLCICETVIKLECPQLLQ